MIDLTKKYRTRDGREVTLISDKGRGDFPIVGYLKGREAPAIWTQDGRYTLAGDMCSDLIEVKEMKKVWVNLYVNEVGHPFTVTYQDEMSASRYRASGFIKTVEIEYEVGEGALDGK